MGRSNMKYTFMRKHKKSGRIEEGISSNDPQVMKNLMRAANVEDQDWNCWIQTNAPVTQLQDIFILT